MATYIIDSIDQHGAVVAITMDNPIFKDAKGASTATQLFKVDGIDPTDPATFKDTVDGFVFTKVSELSRQAVAPEVQSLIGAVQPVVDPGLDVPAVDGLPPAP